MRGKSRVKIGIAVILLAMMLTGTMLGAYAAVNVENQSKSSQKTEKSLVGGGYAASGQLDDVGYVAKMYDASNGLPTSEANCIMGSDDGYVWIGGYSGIIKYDGVEFKRLDSADGLTNGRYLYEDSDGRIWVATNDNGVVVIDGNKSTHFTKEDGLNSSSIRAFAEDKKGNIYIGTTAGINYVDRSMNLFTVDDKRINEERVLRLMADVDGHVYGQGASGCVFSLDSGSINTFYTSESLGMEGITTILTDPKEARTLYFGTESNVVYHGRFGKKAGELKKIKLDPMVDVHWMTYMCDRVWISSENMLGYLDKKEHFHIIKDLPMNDSIEMMTSDYQGNIWMASSRQGVMKIVVSNFQDYSANAGMEQEVVNTTCLHNGELYIGTDIGLRIISKNQKVKENKLTKFFNGDRIRCIIEDEKKNIWVATFTEGKGLVRISEDGKISTYTVDEGMPSDEIRCIAKGSNNSIIVGTNGGVAVIKDSKIQRIIGKEQGMKNTVILTVCEGNDGCIFAGSDGNGLYKIKGDKITVLNGKHGLTSDVIMRVKKDDRKDLYWIITSNSIQYMKGGKIKNIKSFPYNNNFDLFDDGEKKLWVLSSQGVYSVKEDDMLKDNITDYKLYTLANGLTSLPIAHCYSELDKDDNLYIAGQTGVSKVNINKYFNKMSYIKTNVGCVCGDDVEIEPNEKGVYVIPARTNRIHITPDVLDYTMTNPMVRVYLDGSRDKGIITPQDRIASLEYTELPYGDYVLHIQILDENGIKVLSDETFNIKKTPTVFELLAVRVFALALIAILAGVIVWRVMTGTVIRKQYVQIQEAKDEAIRANLAKSRFLANMSHEIRTPINTILGMDEMILREESTGVPKKYYMSVVNYALDIKSSTDSLLGLINDLLDISKIESGKMHLVEQEYDTVELLRSVITMIRVRSEAKKLFFDVEIDEELPKRLYGDGGKIKQIILNFLTNAVKYTEEGGFTLKVKVSEKTDLSCKLRLSVKDTGMGVKQEDMDKLFSAYERLDEEKNSGIQGTGLGLNISRQFAELMNGELWCESVYGEGSEFILSLTQKIADEDTVGVFHEEEDTRVRGPYVPQFVAPDADILVVDDNPINLTVMKGLLKPTEVFVTTAESGKECLEKLKVGNFNVVFLDHMMPGMDGVETMAKIREKYPDLPVYALTANATAGGEKFYTSKGFNGYLEKPIDTVAVEHTIMKHLPEEIMKKPSVKETEVEESSLQDNLEWLNEVEGVSLEDGIKNSGGISSFNFALNLFYDTIDENSKVIEDAYKEGDIKLYTVKVHALKSSARIIGAMELSELCRKLEEAGNKRDMIFIDANTKVLLKKYREYKDKLARLDEENAVTEDVDKEPIPDSELEAAYVALREVIPQMDYDAVEMIINELKEYKLSEKDEEKIAKLGKLLKTFDWDAMENVIEG
ncbi:MAG: response regulator [Lachnospiraceae bacterium]|nr:response regulator [Lachnospiraceae bacterium]